MATEPPARRVTLLGLLTATALVLTLVEGAIPRPLPWLKLGLGNAAVLAALLLCGARPAVAVALVKIAVGGLLSGGLGGPAFAIGGGAGLASVAAMAGLHRLARPVLSPVGLSAAGAVVHQATQLLIASVYLGHPGLLALMPLFLVTGVATGLLTGVAAYASLARLDRAARAGALP